MSIGTSVAEVFGASSLSMILTRMGQDGLKGFEALCAARAFIILQDEATSVVWVCRALSRAGLAEKILPLDQIANEIIRRVAVQSSLQLTH